MSNQGNKSSQSQSGTSLTSREEPSANSIERDAGAEPVANRVAVPVLFIAALGAALFWGDTYLVNHGGELDARVYAPYRSVEELNSYQPKGAGDILKAKGQKVYKQYCSACHQDDGNGNPSAFVPPLAGSDWVAHKDPSRIIRIVLNGLSGPITVNGKQWGQAVMLPWRDGLNDEDIAAVLTYVRASWGNKAPAINVEDVKAIRDATKDKGGNWSPDELLQIPLKD